MTHLEIKDQEYVETLFIKDAVTDLPVPVTVSGGVVNVGGLPISGSSQSSLYPIWAEESGALSNNNTQWSYGNGATGTIGIVVPEAAQVEYMTFEADVVGTSVTIDLVVNNIVTTVVAPFVGEKGVYMLPVPFPVLAGDTIGFRTNTEVGAYSDARVTAWLRKV